MKLYRGLKSNEYKEYTQSILDHYNANWKEILKRRDQGNFSYPEDLNQIVTNLFKHQYLVRQYFTDNKTIAENYAKKEDGLLIEIDVPIDDIINYFILEFQNYPKRKQSFEITYIVKGIDLVRFSDSWKLKIK